MFKKLLYKSVFIGLCSLAIIGCKEEEYVVPEAKSGLQNDCIKKTLGPNLVGSDIEFAYAMAIKADEGKLLTAKVEASIAGATGTYLQHNSFYTTDAGIDVGVPVGTPSVTTGNTTQVTFNVDTNAATLRYYYRIPAEAMDKEVSFTFTVTSSNGQSATYKMGPYKVRRMDRALNLAMSDANRFYLSIEDLAVYNATEAAANPGKIDLVYLYRTSAAANTFLHSLVAPSANPIYLPGITLPAGVNRSTKLQKTLNLRDPQLAAIPNGVFIDDIDFQQINLDNAPDFALNLKAEAGVWVETADKKYRAFVYINSVNNTTKSVVVSIKRYLM